MNTNNGSHPQDSKPINPTFHHSHNIIQSLKAKADAKRSRSEVMADWITETFGSMVFLIANMVWFALWVILNSGVIPSFTPFDPFPFGLLTTIVSLEAILLAIFVLISQNRASKIADLREEVDLHVDIVTEEELTKLLQMVNLLCQKQGIDMSKDADLQTMLQPTNLRKIEETLEQEVIGHKPHVPSPESQP